MRLSHTLPVGTASFDEPNLVSAAGLVPVMRLAADAGLDVLAGELLRVPSDQGANAGGKVNGLVAGMLAGADSIDDMALLRHGAMGKVFERPYAPSTLGSFLRAFTFGHVRQLDAVASRFLTGLAGRAPLLPGLDGMVLVDRGRLDHRGARPRQAGRQLRLHPGAWAEHAAGHRQYRPGCAGDRRAAAAQGFVRFAARRQGLVADALRTVRSLRPETATAAVLLRADSAFYGSPTIGAAVRAGAQVSVTVRMDPKVKAAIATIADDAWTSIEYTDAVFDEHSGQWISRAEVAEVPFTAFSSRKPGEQVQGRLVVRRIPDLNPPASPDQASLFQVWRFHAFFTTSDLDSVTADKTTAATRSSSRSTPT